MTRSENEVDQIVFRWDSENLSGSTGFGPVAWSGARDEAENLFRTSGPLLRASGDETRPALIRLQRRAEVMLIRRLPFTDAGGRASVLCHALVGSPELLEPATCLGLRGWDWEGADIDAGRVRGRLPVIREDVLVPATGRGQGDLDSALDHVVEELTGMVAELLRHPEERFTVLDERGDTACPVLWGLHSMFGSLTDRRWTFATHDTVELPALRFVFVGRWSGAASRNTDRRRVDPRERLGDRAEDVATRLVRRHLRGIAEGEGGEYAVGSALHAAASVRGARLLDTAARALDTLDRRTPGPDRRPGPFQETAGPAAPEAPRSQGRKWGWPLGGGCGTEDAQPGAGDAPVPRAGARDVLPGAHEGVPGAGGRELRGDERPGPYDFPELWFRPDPPASPGPQDRLPAARTPDPGPTPSPNASPSPSPHASPTPTPNPSPHANPSPSPTPPPAPAATTEHRPAPPHHLPAQDPGPGPYGGHDGPDARPDPLTKHPAQKPGADPYPRPVLPFVAPVWTGPAAAGKGNWARLPGRGREREAETGLVHKLPAARTVEEARELVERGGDRELLNSLRRPQAYIVLTLLLAETARRLPSWEHPLRRELCEVAIGREFWAVAPPGAAADPSDPPEEQRAANAAELHRWAVRPLLGAGDAPVGTVAELLSRLRTSPVPSARETFWLIVDGERPGLPEAVWLSLLKEAYGMPRSAPRPAGPSVGPAAGPDDPGNGYTRRFLRRAGLLIGGLVAAILLVAVWGRFS
ncbi:hypothetical protein DEJ44_27155 [Streptomyces venezuelae]|uniref:hypothetical protein n=1 Tax=Streptomyces venezuelae TaxID=54571 RepID=UPI00123B55D8|nr:hypothetical protein [Streptomyces venezuelae]QES08934.1 hypothetical protein DEJ44_27155 [Streptomyces venezuelae]